MGNQWLERELEDYAKTNINALAQMLVPDTDGFDMIGVQIPCLLGRIDMLCTWRMSLFVIEFKAVKATEKELGQTLRYSSLLQNLIDPYQHIAGENFFPIANRIDYRVIPVIVAPDFDKTLFVSNCTLVQAAKTGDGVFALNRAQFPFGLKDFERKNTQLQSLIAPYEKGLVGRAIGELIAMGIPPKSEQSS